MSTDEVSLRESRYFDQVVQEAGDFNPFQERGWQTLRTQFQTMVAPKHPVTLLDVGCGTGESHRIYATDTASYTGIDLSEQAIARARQRLPEQKWVCGDACALPFADNFFDVVAFSSVLHHIPDYTVALREARRVLRPGGAVFAFDPNRRHPAMALFRDPKSPFYNSNGVSPNERPLLPSELRRAFDAAGIAAIQQHCQSDLPYREVAPRLMNAMLAGYNILDRIAQQVGLARWFGTFVITAGRKPD